VSDLHLGTHGGRDVLRGQRAGSKLREAVAAADRLVLLGDVLELRHGARRDALAVAERPLTELGAALRPGTEVCIVPGNHDYALLADWLERRDRSAARPPEIGLQEELDVQAGDTLARLTGWLEPGAVRVFYPGVWLRDDVYATHGHYVDLHLTMPTLERLAAGVMSRIVSLPPGGPQTIGHYEAALSPIYGWIDSVAQRIAPELGGHLHGGSVRGWRALRGRDLRRRAVAAAFPAVVFALNRAGLGPLRADLSGAALRRSGLRAIDEVTGRLGVSADYVIFGHTHRAGPLPGDDQSEWRTHAGTRLINSGCWVDEPAFAGANPTRSPYRVGFAVWVDDSGPPTLTNLLDGVSRSDRV
jgi:hypothetical protein